MVIKRSTLEFIIIAIMLGSLMAAATFLGPGAGVILLMIWAIGFFTWLKYRKPAAKSEQESQEEDTTDAQDPPESKS